MNEKPIKKKTIRRLIKTMFQFYPVMVPLTIICIIFSAVVTAAPAVFMQKIISVLENLNLKTAIWSDVSKEIFFLVGILVGFYVLAFLSCFAYNQLMAIITQGMLKKLRCKMFSKMQNLPIQYFDTNTHGDIMSHYTNDIDTLRQMISQSFPQLLISAVTMIALLGIMLYYSLWLTLIILVGVAIMLVITKFIGSGSAKFFFRQQTALGRTEGFVEEMMNGQKVIKVFCHEEESETDFAKYNEELYNQSVKAHKYANILIPILNNIGNVLYVIIAIIGGIFIINNVANVSISREPIGISIIVPFLSMAKQFVGSVNQVSNQINCVVMGIAGTQRIFNLMDQQAEQDDGYVTLVNVREENGKWIECENHTGVWAWKHPHQADGSVTYTKLMGDVRLYDVDFAYEEGKTILHHISLYAKPGQKIAFVGATGAGKTTITNLLNRFYDIADGKIRYDNININKIKKADLRNALGIVLQDVNLFTGTVIENIRYGKLDATDEECQAAAKLAGAHDFITRLPDGYHTMLTGNGANLSQGQRQLISIARAAVADPPVMILDEATSSIDTRTEAIVQRGMDNLMKGRTVFVIAHRLSTVKNSDVIIVLDHGNIIERGTHEQLLDLKGQYYQLYTGAFELE